MALTCAFFT